MKHRPLKFGLACTALAGSWSFLVASLIAASAPGAATTSVIAAPARPNVIVIMTDDMRKDDLQAMPTTRHLLSAQDGLGATYSNFYVTLPLCCPSRATFLTGQFPHNHGVWDNVGDHGGFPAFDDSEALPAWMQAAGYRTAFLGKYFNGYGVGDSIDYIPPGWDSFAGLVGEYGQWTNYRDFDINRNGELVQKRSDYQTTDFTTRALYQIRQMSSQPPMFMWLSMLAPHVDASQRAKDGGYSVWAPKKYRTSTAGKPKSAAFDEADVSDKPSWIRSQPRLTDAKEAAIVRERRERQNALHVVDESVGRIIAALRAQGELGNTLIMFTSDNGYMLGEHRVTTGKMYPYEESARQPLLMRGPGVTPGVHREPALNVDLASTIASAAAATPTRPVDGVDLLGSPPSMARPLLLESPKADVRPGLPSYAGVVEDGWQYLEYGDGQKELYNLAADPWQQRNRIAAPGLADVRQRLAAELDRLRDCAGEGCRP